VPIPRSATSGSTPIATRLASASNALPTLCTPGIITDPSSRTPAEPPAPSRTEPLPVSDPAALPTASPGSPRPAGPMTWNRWPKPDRTVCRARQVAAGSPAADTVIVSGLTSLRPAGSSTLTTSCSHLPSNSAALAVKYSARSAWKSRWSTPRLVNPPTANRVPSTRPSASAWLDTSMITVVIPRSRATAYRACRSGASGVVRTLSIRSSPSRVSTVPINVGSTPAARNPESIRYAVDVFPAVPVIPSTVSRAVGSPYTAAATRPRDIRGSATTSAGSPAASAATAPVASVSTATAPALAASATNSAPCRREPRSAAYRSPGRTEPLAWVTPVTRTSPSGAGTPSTWASPASGYGCTVRGRG
jgi:hypothetical protein